jgi:hypothetical protein
MKKQIYLLLVAVTLNLSNGAQASAYLPRATRQAVPLISRYAVRPGGLSQGVLQYAKQPIQQQFAQPGLSMPAMRTFATKAPELVARPQYSYWQQLKNSPTARWMAGLLAGGTLIGTGSALAEESESKPQEGIFKRWFGKLRGYAVGQLKKQSLFDGIKSRDLMQIRDALRNGAHINLRDSTENTPLNQALRAEKRPPNMYTHPYLSYDLPSYDIVKELIRAGADVNARDSKGNTPLAQAVRGNKYGGRYRSQYSNPAIVKELLEAGANANAKDRYGTPILFVAIQNGNLESLKLLLQHGADINNATNKFRATALEFANRYGYSAAIPLLEAAATDPLRSAKMD